MDPHITTLLQFTVRPMFPTTLREKNKQHESLIKNFPQSNHNTQKTPPSNSTNQQMCDLLEWLVEVEKILQNKKASPHILFLFANLLQQLDENRNHRSYILNQVEKLKHVLKNLSNCPVHEMEQLYDNEKMSKNPTAKLILTLIKYLLQRKMQLKMIIKCLKNTFMEVFSGDYMEEISEALKSCQSYLEDITASDIRKEMLVRKENFIISHGTNQYKIFHAFLEKKKLEEDASLTTLLSAESSETNI